MYAHLMFLWYEALPHQGVLQSTTVLRNIYVRTKETAEMYVGIPSFAGELEVDFAICRTAAAETRLDW